MGDIYVEALIEKKPNKNASFLKTVFTIFGVLLCIGGVLYIPFLILGVMTITFTVVFLPPANLEYEYLFLEKTLTIDQIANKTKRKRVCEYDLNKMEKVCVLNSHELDNVKSSNIKVVDFSADYETSVKYGLVYRDGEKSQLVIIEMTDELLKAFKSVFPRKVIEY